MFIMNVLVIENQASVLLSFLHTRDAFKIDVSLRPSGNGYKVSLSISNRYQVISTLILSSSPNRHSESAHPCRFGVLACDDYDRDILHIILTLYYLHERCNLG